MHTLHPATAVRAPENVFKPRLVVTKGHEVAGHFEWTENCQAHLFARHLAANQTLPVCIYEVDWRLPLPPPAGTFVDAEDYDWVLVSYRQPAGRHARTSHPGASRQLIDG